jgi:hypothetical protein
MWHIFTSTNNTTTILFPTQLWELLYTYHVIKQCTEKETTSLSKEYNGMDSLDSIFSDQRQKDVMNNEYLFNDSETHE